jgi:hypothetical protein
MRSWGRCTGFKSSRDWLWSGQELVRAKVEQRAPEAQLVPAGEPSPKVINIMQAPKRACRRRDVPRCTTPCGAGRVKRRSSQEA